MPEKRKRKMLKVHLNNSYKEMRKNILSEILRATDSHCNSEEIEKLLNHKYFEETFDNKKWDVFYNAINRDNHYIEDILNEFELFNRELDTVILLCPLKENAYNTFKNVQDCIFTLQKLDYKTYEDNIKPFCRTLSEIFEHFDFANGYHDNDPIQDRIDAL
ncbi:hypothetical protein [Candidatus Endomicrobiellum agilis]|uniref:hypothetical protein n=1 Tax=Candidatus Endomicrobiellum agilis TaxID=3238957 RepID=UPI0035759DA2|nr:hypothetical protein [Endomicrobium sp.]